MCPKSAILIAIRISRKRLFDAGEVPKSPDGKMHNRQSPATFLVGSKPHSRSTLIFIHGKPTSQKSEAFKSGFQQYATIFIYLVHFDSRVCVVTSGFLLGATLVQSVPTSTAVSNFVDDTSSADQALMGGIMGIQKSIQVTIGVTYLAITAGYSLPTPVT